MRTWYINQLAMYAAYHRDKRNKITHFIGVPLIVFSLMLVSWGVSLFSVAGYTINLAELVIALLVLSYIVVSPLVGVLLLIDLSIGLWLASLVVAMGPDVVLYGFLGGFIGGWIIQFYGHVFEGRKPALFDNLVQILMAPFFLMAEVTFKLGLAASLQEEIEAQTYKFERPET